MHPIEFYSRKQSRVTRSTFAAELNTQLEATELGMLYVGLFEEGHFLLVFPVAVDWGIDIFPIPKTQLSSSSSLFFFTQKVSFRGCTRNDSSFIP